MARETDNKHYLLEFVLLCDVVTLTPMAPTVHFGVMR